MAEAVFEPLFAATAGPVATATTETPCDPLPAVPDERRGRRSRFAVGLGVGLVGAASLTTAVYQTITQSSTTVGLPSEVAEVDTPLPWAAATTPGTPAASTTITPTVADLDLRADQQPLPAAPVGPVAAPLAGVPAVVGPVGTPAGPPAPVADAGPRPAPPARGERPAPSSGASSGRPSGTTTPPSSEPPPSSTPSSGTPSETPSSGTPSSETPSRSAEPAPSSGSDSAEPSTPATGSSSAPADAG